MSQMFPQLDAAVVRVTSDVRDRHLRTVSQALADLRPRRSRFRLLAVAVAVLFVLPVLALAARNADPGDFLYPVRQILPWSDRAPIDGDLVDEGPTITDIRPDGVTPDDVAPSAVDRTDGATDVPSRDRTSSQERHPSEPIPDSEPRPPPDGEQPTNRDGTSPGPTVPGDSPPDRRGDRP